MSYSSIDGEWVRTWLLPRLDAAGIKVCIDFRAFVPGQPILKNVESACEQSDVLLPVMTPAWLESQWAELESLLFQSADASATRGRLVPLLFKDCVVPKRLSILTWLDFSRRSNREFTFQRLITLLRSRFAAASKEATSSSERLTSPLAEALEKRRASASILNVLSGPSMGIALPVPQEPGEVRIGRGEDCDLQLDTPDVSRKHVTVLALRGRVILRDEKSKTGTRVNGRLTSHRLLRDADVIEVGKTRIRYQSVAALNSLPQVVSESFGVSGTANAASILVNEDLGLYGLARTSGRTDSQIEDPVIEVLTGFIHDTVLANVNATWPFPYSPELSLDGNRLRTAARLAIRRLAAQSESDVSDLGANFVVCFAAEGDWHVASVGECCAFLIRPQPTRRRKEPALRQLFGPESSTTRIEEAEHAIKLAGGQSTPGDTIVLATGRAQNSEAILQGLQSINWKPGRRRSLRDLSRETANVIGNSLKDGVGSLVVLRFPTRV